MEAVLTPTGGQVVVPREVLDRLGREPGLEIRIRLVDGAFRLETVRDPLSLRGKYRGLPPFDREKEDGA